MRFDSRAPRRDPSWLAFGLVFVLIGGCVSIASLHPLGVVGGVLVVIGVVVSAGIRDEDRISVPREFDKDLLENFRDIKSSAIAGRLGEDWSPEVTRELEKCSSSWQKVDKALARRRWIYRSLTKGWRDLWVDTAWAADCAMLEALWAAQNTRSNEAVIGLSTLRKKSEALLHLTNISTELNTLAFHISKDVFRNFGSRSVVQTAIMELEIIERSREELDRDVPTNETLS